MEQRDEGFSLSTFADIISAYSLPCMMAVDGYGRMKKCFARSSREVRERERVLDRLHTKRKDSQWSTRTQG